MNDAAVTRRKWHGPVWLALFGLAGLIAAFFALRGYCNPGYTPVAFTAEVWAEADHERRGHMVDDLLAAHELIGLDDAEVVALLGPADDELRDEVSRRWRYHLGRMGRHPDCPLTDLSLLVLFDERGIVTSAYTAD